jgi:hypothetical protein
MHPNLLFCLVGLASDNSFIGYQPGPRVKPRGRMPCFWAPVIPLLSYEHKS